MFPIQIPRCLRRGVSLRDISKHLAENYADQSGGWMHWAYALREMDQIEEAKAVALRGLELHPEVAILYYNLACYLSLLGRIRTSQEAPQPGLRSGRAVQGRVG